LPTACFDTAPLRVLRMPGNLGFAAANNRALDVCETEWLALLNPDARPEPDWLERLLGAADRHPEVDAFGSKQLLDADPTRLDGIGDTYHVCGAAWRVGYLQTDRPGMALPGEIFAPCAAAAMYRRDALRAVGGFDEAYFCYFEDVDLGFRLRLRGYRCRLAADAVVRHVGSATTGGQQSDFAVYHGHRNLVWTYVKDMPGPWFWIYLPQHLLFNAVALLYFTARGQARAIWRAKWHALKGLPAAWRKRRATQAARRVTWPALRGVMSGGLLAPYRRKLGTLAPGA
jgi:GT2 family glycosyltransferase